MAYVDYEIQYWTVGVYLESGLDILWLRTGRLIEIIISIGKDSKKCGLYSNCVSFVFIVQIPIS